MLRRMQGESQNGFAYIADIWYEHRQWLRKYEKEMDLTTLIGEGRIEEIKVYVKQIGGKMQNFRMIIAYNDESDVGRFKRVTAQYNIRKKHWTVAPDKNDPVKREYDPLVLNDDNLQALGDIAKTGIIYFDVLDGDPESDSLPGLTRIEF